MNANVVSISKFLSLVLRHQPEVIGLTLDENGWADIDELMRLSILNGKPLSREVIEHVVSSNDKNRFTISEDQSRIRANQGHSLVVDLGLQCLIPPDVLYHGTAFRFLKSIQTLGLVKGNRQHVHLSVDEITAVTVGARHGRPVVLVVAAMIMHENGHLFYRSENGVWLTEHVPNTFLKVME